MAQSNSKTVFIVHNGNVIKLTCTAGFWHSPLCPVIAICPKGYSNGYFHREGVLSLPFVCHAAILGQLAEKVLLAMQEFP